jgi:predicted phosphoribosyltransferase
MIFQNPIESAKLLAQKIIEEGIDIRKSLLVYIDPEDQKYCQIIADELKQKLIFLPNLLIDTQYQILDTKYLIIADSGNTRGVEYNEFTDKIRKEFPTLEIILAIPVIAQSEEEILKSNCDQLLTLGIEPLFFSINQFYISNTY